MESTQALDILNQLQENFRAFSGSPAVFWLKVFLAIYVIVMLIDIVLIVALHSPSMYYRIMKAGANVPAPLKSRMKKRWAAIQERLRTGNISQYKVAILEADKMADEVLTAQGYKGANMGERLDRIMPEQLEMVGELKRAHETRNRIVYKEDFALDLPQAKETLRIFQKLFETLEYID